MNDIVGQIDLSVRVIRAIQFAITNGQTNLSDLRNSLLTKLPDHFFNLIDRLFTGKVLANI